MLRNGGILFEVPPEPMKQGMSRSNIVTLVGGQPVTSLSTSSFQVKPVYSNGAATTSTTGLLNASLVELGKKLLSAAREGDKAEVGRLLAKGAPMTTDWLGTSPLHLAAQYGHAETAEVLLRSGCQRDARTKVEKTPLHVAAQEGHDNVAELLLSNGADVECTDMLKMTPLHWAVERGNVSTVETLLRFGAYVNVETKFGKSSLEIASDVDRPDILEMLQHADQYRSPDCPTKSDAATLAATQSILPSDDLFSLDEALSDAFNITGLDEGKIKEEPIDNVDNTEFLASQGITFSTDDSPGVAETSSDQRLVVNSTGGRITLARVPAKHPAASLAPSTASKPTITRIVKLSVPSVGGHGAKTQIVKSIGQGISTSSNAPKIIKVTPEQFAALKAGNTAKLTTLPQLETIGVRRPAGSDNPSNRQLKIVRVNPSVSIQPKKPTVVTIGGSMTSTTQASPGFTLKTTSVPSTPKTVIVTKPSPSTSNSDELKRQLEESQRMLEQFKEQLRRKEVENARLKMLLGNN